MKKFLFTALLALLAAGVGAQEQQKEEGYRFTDVKTLPVTSVKNQNRSGTCWAYSALAFLESEILRNGGGEYDLSAMWIVRNAYFEKAVKYARMHGSLNLAVGGGSRDVTDGIRKYGIVPTEVYPGLCYGTDLPDFTEIDRVVKGYMDAVIAGDKLTTAWQRGLDAVLDAYLGPKPENSPGRARSIRRSRSLHRWGSTWTTTSRSAPIRTTPSTRSSSSKCPTTGCGERSGTCLSTR